MRLDDRRILIASLNFAAAKDRQIRHCAGRRSLASQMVLVNLRRRASPTRDRERGSLVRRKHEHHLPSGKGVVMLFQIVSKVRKFVI